MSATVPLRGSPITGTVLRIGRVSVRIYPRSVAVCTVLAVSIVFVGVWSISAGDFPVPLGDVVDVLLRRGSSDAEFIVGTLRLPRLLTAVLVGAAFAAAGGIFQSLVQNPLASPDIVGFNSGAAFGAVFMIVVLGRAATTDVAFGAVLGGFVTAVVVYVFAYKRGVNGYRLILVGIGIGFAASALVDYLLTRAEIYEVQRATVWLTGSLNGRGWEHVRPIAVAAAVLLPAAGLLGARLRSLELGSDSAAALGVAVGRARLGLVVVAVLLAALATASAGPIGFVALVSPAIARRLVRSASFVLVPTALVGALLTAAADLAARRVLAPRELPVGVATAVLGAPYLLWLLAREIRSGAM